MTGESGAGVAEYRLRYQSLPQDALKLKMYQLPGDPPLIERDFLNYLRSNEAIKGRLPQVVKMQLTNPDSKIRQSSVRLIEEIPEGERAELLRERILRDEDVLVKLSAISVIRTVPEIDQQRLREEALPLVKKALADSDLTIRIAAVKAIAGVPEGEKAKLIERMFRDKNPNVAIAAVQVMRYSSESERTGLIQKALNHTNSYVRREMIREVPKVPKGERREIISDTESEITGFAVNMIKYAPKEEKSDLIKVAIDHADWNIRWKAINLINEASDVDQQELRTIASRLVREGLRSQDYDMRLSAIQGIRGTLHEDRTEFISEGLVYRNFGTEFSESLVRHAAAEAIQYAPESDKADLIKIALADRDKQVSLAVLKTVPRQALEQMQIDNPSLYQEFENLSASSLLYNNEEDTDRYYQRSFTKADSITMLMDIVPNNPDETFKNRIIERIIPIEPYLQWKKVFEATEAWKVAGFDYVPVEPIVRTKFDDSLPPQVSAYTRVLRGPSVWKWLQKSELYQKEIDEDMSRIKTALQDMGVEHGHLDGHNFVVVFDTGPDGKPDLSHRPHVYAIDFDRAVSV